MADAPYYAPRPAPPSIRSAVPLASPCRPSFRNCHEQKSPPDYPRLWCLNRSKAAIALFPLIIFPSGGKVGPDVEILMPRKKPRGQVLTPDQQRGNRSLNERRLRIEHVNSSIKRCRIVKDRLRLWKQGIRDRVMEICCALHNFRVRLTPWQQMI